MAKSPKRWVYSPKAAPKPPAPQATKQFVQEQCDAFVEATLKPRCINPPPEDSPFSYIVDLYNRWHRSFFYFCAKFRCPSPDCLSEFFEVTYTRLEYVGENRFHLAYMRHTGKWQTVYYDLTLKQCLKTIETEALFQP